jgi:hypothetical protein
MAKTGKKVKTIQEQLSGNNLSRIMNRAIRNALKENLRLNIPIPIKNDKGKIVMLDPRKVVK